MTNFFRRAINAFRNHPSPASRQRPIRPAVEALEERALMSMSDMTQLAQLFPAHAGPTIVYLNFDGGLVAGRSIAAFQPVGGDTRNADINAILSGVAHDFAPFNVEVEQISGAGNYDSSSFGNTTVFIGGDSNNISGNSKNVYSVTPWNYMDYPGQVKGYTHRPNSDPFDLAFVDPTSGQAISATWVTTQSIAQIVASVAHEVGHTLGLAHVISDPKADMMNYGSASFNSFLDQAFTITDLNNTGTSTANDARLDVIWQETPYVFDKMATQDSYSYLMAVLGRSQNQLALAKDMYGRMESSAIGPNHDLIYQVQSAPGGSWGAWQSLGGYVESFVVSHNQDGRLEAFAIGGDNRAYHTWQDSSGGWSGWYSFGGYVRELEVGINADGRMELFAIGYDYDLYNMWQVAPNSGWSGWNDLHSPDRFHVGGLQQIAVGKNQNGSLEVFGIGYFNHGLYHVSQSSGWTAWSSLGGYVKQISVGSNADGRLEVFAIGGDNALWHCWQLAPNGIPLSLYDNGWSSWDSLGGYVKQITVGNNADGRLEAFAIGDDNALYHIWENYQSSSDNWSGWSRLGGYVRELAIGSNAYGRLEFLGIDSDNTVNHDSQTIANAFWAWTGWYSDKQQTL